MLQEIKSRIKPPLYFYIPDRYQLIYHIFTGPDGNIWIFLRSKEKTGFLRYTAEGHRMGFYSLAAEFDITKPDTLVRVNGNRMPFLVKGRKSLKIYVAEFPPGS